ncbi:MAG: substrate-binding domain-containing protein [Zoogloeaceae bacterium]|jgi:phosphate transport system substrate-binding protein|nr:substrate-binding domain-containing protein [Zoogloeaceae bacterium]
MLELTACQWKNEFDPQGGIAVIAREHGSGTRSAFGELFGLEEKTPSGKKDLTAPDAQIAEGTEALLAAIAAERQAIGYVSLGAVDARVKALPIYGIEASIDNLKKGVYTLMRPFYLATRPNAPSLAVDFLEFVRAREGQVIVGQRHIAIDENAPAYVGKPQFGKIEVCGSSSVTPMLEKLKSAYLKHQPRVQIDIRPSDSSAGLTLTRQGRCDIAMSSRSLTEAERKQLLPTRIALDGIAVIVHPDNPMPGLQREQVQQIFMGKSLRWADLVR